MHIGYRVFKEVLSVVKMVEALFKLVKVISAEDLIYSDRSWVSLIIGLVNNMRYEFLLSDLLHIDF